jgi:hypothetical protein
MTATQHGRTLRHEFLYYITIKIMLGFYINCSCFNLFFVIFIFVT